MKKAGHITVVLGVIDLKTDVYDRGFVPPEGAHFSRVKRWHLHPKHRRIIYNLVTLYDLALLELERHVPYFSDRIQPACLPFDHEPETNLFMARYT